MINVSKEFRTLMKERTDFKENAEITFADGTIIELSEKDFTVSNNSVVDSAGSNGIPLGVALCRSIQIELMNDDDRFSTYDFFGAKIRLYLTFALSETIERIEYGTFTVLAPETYGTTIIISALDDMHKADIDYNTSLNFPATIRDMLRDACVTLGISQGTTSFLNDDFVVNEKPADITFRQLFGYIAMIAGGNARIDRTGRLRIITYDFETFNQISGIDGGIYTPWNNPADLDGGAFNPWNVGDVADGGTFDYSNNYHTLVNWSNLKVDTDDVVITGIQTNYTDSDNKEQKVIYGAEGYVLLIDNPLIAGQEERAVELIGTVMVGGRFRQFSGDLVANPTIEFMDFAIIVDYKGNYYNSFITDINFQFFGFTSIKNSAEPALRNSAKAYSEATKTFVKAKKLVDKERTEREKAVEQFAKDLSESSGLYVTTEKQPDGSTIYYMHDKQTLKESMIVWKLTALAFGISTDGGKTYPYGFTVDGETITRLLYAEGIDADYITSGTIDAKKINVINVVAKSVAAENITGELFNGKKYVSNIKIGTYNTQTSIDGGTITSKITNSSVKSVLDYFGLSIVSSNGSQKTEIGSTNINISSTGFEADLTNTRLLLKSTYSQTEIAYDSITAKASDYSITTIEGKKIKSFSGQYDYATIEGKTIESYAGASNYSKLIGSELTLYKGSTDNLEITTNALTFAGNSSIKYGTTSLMEFTSNSVTVKGSYTYLGTSGGSLGFFGTTTKSTKKSVSTITSTSSATTSSNATKINEIINALKAYNLI